MESRNPRKIGIGVPQILELLERGCQKLGVPQILELLKRGCQKLGVTIFFCDTGRGTPCYGHLHAS